MTEEASPPDQPQADQDGAASGPKPDASFVGAEHDGAASGTKPSAGAEPAPSEWRPNYVFLAVVSIVSLAADLGTKQWAKVRLEDARYGESSIEVIKGFFSFHFARNLGGAWGLLQGEPESVRRPFFLGISVVAIVFIVSLYRKLTREQIALKWGLPLVLGGALGNLVNRIQYNYVVDFIDFRATWGGRTHHWPTFNVADIAIVVGVILMAIDMFTPRRVARAPEAGGAAPKET